MIYAVVLHNAFNVKILLCYFTIIASALPTTILILMIKNVCLALLTVKHVQAKLLMTVSPAIMNRIEYYWEVFVFVTVLTFKNHNQELVVKTVL